MSLLNDHTVRKLSCMKKALIGLLILVAPFCVFSEEASEESIRALMQRSGAGDMGLQVMNQLVPALKQMAPDAPEEFWQNFMAEFSADELIQLTIPVYQKHLSQDDIDALNKFYDTAAGQNMIKAQPMIMQESMIIGQAWGQGIAKKVLEKYQAQTEAQAK